MYDGLKEQQQDNIQKYKDEIVKSKDEIKKLKATIEKQAIKLRENYNEITKLKDKVEIQSKVTKSSLEEGALQLRELLMSEHQGSTVGEMLGFCFKDITRNYPKDRDDDTDDDAVMENEKTT
jgi:glucosamine 6-phosphate synthetase-like amidotransferase/phosphosugar isomerase protein